MRLYLFLYILDRSLQLALVRENLFDPAVIGSSSDDDDDSWPWHGVSFNGPESLEDDESTDEDEAGVEAEELEPNPDPEPIEVGAEAGVDFGFENCHD